MEDYTNFISYLNESMVKLKELLEKVTILHNETAIALLETSSLYNPQILIDISEMAVTGRKFDKFILEGQEMKSQLENILARPQKSADDYSTILEELCGIHESLKSKFSITI